MPGWKLCVFLLTAGFGPLAGRVESFQQIPFQLEFERATLSGHQRLVGILSVKMDGADIVRRFGEAEFSLKCDVRDERDRLYAMEGNIDFRGARKDTHKAVLYYPIQMFLLPGRYRARVRVLDNSSGQEGSAERDFKVDALGNDPLPDSWRDLPPVEFFQEGDPPGSWILPEIHGRLNWTLASKAPVKVELLVNATPTDLGGGVEHQNSLTMATVLPAAKAIFQTVVENGSLDMSLLDLAKFKAIFAQDNRKALDWPRLKTSLGEANPNMIDVKSLANRVREGDYFVYEVGQHVRAALKAGEPRHALIVLSGPMNFPAGVMLHRADVRYTDRCKVYYIRYVTPGTPGGYEVRIDRVQRSEPIPDEIDFMLAPLTPRKFEVRTPMEFRRAIAAIYSEISKN